MGQVRILIVEDEPLIAEDLRPHLEELGYEVCATCDNALDAMAEIADLLGFSGPSTLARWHQAQFGIPATLRRKALLAQATGRPAKA